jgi:hypothetical protein
MNVDNKTKEHLETTPASVLRATIDSGQIDITLNNGQYKMPLSQPQPSGKTAFDFNCPNGVIDMITVTYNKDTGNMIQEVGFRCNDTLNMVKFGATGADTSKLLAPPDPTSTTNNLYTDYVSPSRLIAKSTGGFKQMPIKVLNSSNDAALYQIMGVGNDDGTRRNANLSTVTCPNNTMITGVRGFYSSTGVGGIGITCGNNILKPTVIAADKLLGTQQVSGTAPIVSMCPPGEVITQMSGNIGSTIGKVCYKCSGDSDTAALRCVGSKTTATNFGPYYPSTTEISGYTKDITKKGDNAFGFKAIPIRSDTATRSMFDETSNTAFRTNLACPEGTYVAGVVGNATDALAGINLICSQSKDAVCAADPNHRLCKPVMVGKYHVSFNKTIDTTVIKPQIHLSVSGLETTATTMFIDKAKNDIKVYVDESSITSTGFDIILNIGSISLYKNMTISWIAFY